MKTLIKAVVPKRLRPAFRRPYTCVLRKLFLTKLFGHYASLIPAVGRNRFITARGVGERNPGLDLCIQKHQGTPEFQMRLKIWQAPARTGAFGGLSKAIKARRMKVCGGGR
jgi:hypothetical protein